MRSLGYGNAYEPSSSPLGRSPTEDAPLGVRPTFLASGANVKEVLAPPSCRQTEVTLKRPWRGNGPHRITRRRAPNIAPTHSIAGDLSRDGEP